MAQVGKKTVLVTGGEGFIGSHLVKELSKKFRVVIVDLKSGRDIRTLTPDGMKGIDTVFHLAAQAKVPLSIDDPLMTNDHNVTGTLNVLECARLAGVRRVVYSSSASLYAGEDWLPWQEDMQPKPMSPYGVQKLVGEFYCKVYATLYNLETVCLRYFNVFGDGMPVDGAYSAFVAIALDKNKRGEPITIFGGSQTRDMTYVGDVVRANILAMDSRNVGLGECINVGSGKRFSIKELALLISKDLEYEAPRRGEALNSLADISRAKELLGWEPSVFIDEWLKTQ